MKQQESGQFRELTWDECLERLQGHEFGRLAIVVDDEPMIFPMNYAISGSSIVMRTAIGTKYGAAPLSKVAFEIDDVGSGGEFGWSVIARGPAFDVTTSLDDYSDELRRLEVHTWAPGAKDRVMTVAIKELSGRAFGNA